MSKQAETKTKKILFFFLIAIFSFFLAINFLAPPMGEDLILIAFPKDYEITGIKDLMSRMILVIYNQMTGWNIRIGDQLAIIFSCFDELVFDFLNSIAAIIYIWLIYQYAFKRKFDFTKRNVLYLVSLWGAIILLQPALGEIFFWRSGSTNYLWSICILLGFALPLRYYVGKDSIDVIASSKVKTILLTITGFFAGFTNENTVIVFIVLYVGVWIYNFRKKRKTPIWIFTSGSALTIGGICMIKAPSTAIRMKYYRQLFGIEEVKISDYFVRIGNIIERFFSDNFALIIITIIIIFLYIAFVCLQKKDSDEKTKLLLLNSENFGLLCLSSISCGALIMSPYIETRAFLLPDFFMMVCMVCYFEQIIDRVSKYKQIIGMFMGVIITVITIQEGQVILQEYRDYYDYVNLRESAIRLMGDDETFIWGVYQRPYNSRILTTREDYLAENEKGLEKYFSKDINCWENYVWMMNKEDYSMSEGAGTIDFLSYDEENDILSIHGWAVLLEKNADEACSYVYIEIEDKRYYFRTQKLKREDVVDVYDTKLYLNSGFYTEISSLKKYLGEDLSEIEIGVLVLDEQQKLMNEEIKY